KLNKVNRLYAFISEINKCIVHVQDEHDLFRKVCSVAIEFGKFKMAWVGLFNTKNEKITIVGQNGIPARDIKLFKNKRLEVGSPQLNVLLTGTHYLFNDTGRDLKLENQEHIGVGHGIKSFIVLPIRRSGNIIGTFNLYSTVPDFFDTDEIELLLEVTGDISFALDSFEKAKRQKAAEDITAQNEKLFRALIEKSGDMQTLTGKDGEILYSSPSITKVLGYSFEEIRKKKAFDFFYPDDIPGFLKKRKSILQSPGASFYFQLRLRHKYGHYIWCEGTVTNLLHEPGIHAIVTNSRDISERVFASEKLSKSESRLKKAQTIAHVGNWEVDLINKTTFWSDELYNMLGITKHTVEPSYELALSFVHPDDLDFVKKSIGDSFKTRRGTEIDFRFIDKGGRIRHGHGESKFKLDEAGNPVMHFGIIQDITESVLASEKLSKSESRLKEAQAIAHVGSWEVNLITNTDVWSDELYNIFGITKNEIEPSRELFLSFVHPDDASFAKKLLEEGFKTLQGADFEFRFIDKRGQIRYGHCESRLRINEEGKPVTHFGIVQDITESVLASENLLNSESILKEAQAIARVGSWEHDLRKKVSIWSDGLYNIFDITKNEVEPSRELFLSLVHPDDVSFVKKSFEQGEKALRDVDIEFRFIDKGSGIRYVHFESRLKFDAAGNAVRRVGIMQDITERRLFELERISVLNDLIKRNSELEQFAYIISHNLRAPVANIIGASSVLNDPDLSAEEKEILNKGINVSVMRLDDVVKDLNDILEVKKDINTNKEIVRFAALVEDIKFSIADLINQHQIEIKCDFSKINELFILRTYLYSIFYNLISNSIKYRRPLVKSLIEIKSRMVKNKLELIFTDNGTGIDLKKNGGDIFGLYKRFHTDIEGKGMGLFMVKTQVETLGGKISVQSKENEGTEFKIEFEI
ncbi:MAG TPA: PAS domain-containing protein, partial [Mucilaginibacter sp.]